MAQRQGYLTTKQTDGWAVRRDGAQRTVSLHSTKEEAWNETKRRARAIGGEAILQGANGKIQTKNRYGQ